MAQYKFRFWTGRLTSALPIVFFIVWAITICRIGTPDEKGLILGAIIGIVATMFLVRGSWEPYCESIFKGMADHVGVVAIVCWFWAGTFAQVLRVGGLVNGLIWAGQATGVGGGMIVGLTFLLAATFSTAVGTGYGTTVAFCQLMYPVGVLLGADPVMLLGAILSGAAFGDNLAPVSDTTIVSAVTQGADIPGVVRSRFKYAIIAAIPAFILFTIFGGAKAATSGYAVSQSTQQLSPEGLVLLIPFALVIILAMLKKHIVAAITWGIVVAIVIILIFKLVPARDLLYFDIENQQVTGALIDGFMGYIQMAILILMILAAGYIMRAGGAMDLIKNAAFKMIGSSVRLAELTMWFFVAALNSMIVINTAAEITAAPFVREIGEKFNIHPYRRANFLDAVSSALGYIFPWSGGVLIAYSTLLILRKSIPEMPLVNPTDVWPYVFHGWFLVTVMFIAALTGFGRKYEELTSHK